MTKSFWDTPGEGDAAYDPEYVLNRDSEIRQDIRDLVESLWQKYEPYCGDPDFHGRVRHEFNALTWQMYVAVCLLDAGVMLEKADAEGPDIKAVLNGRRVWIECIAVEPGEGQNAAVRTYGKVSRSGTYRPPPDDKIELRLTGGIWEKTKRRDDWIRSGVIAPVDPYVIAICAGHIPDADLEIVHPPIVKILYGLDGIAWTYEVGANKPVETVPTYRDEIERPGKPSVSRRGFLDAGPLNGVSAIIMSARCISSPPRAIGRDLITVHNRVATTPVPLGFLPMGREYWTSDIVEKKDHRAPLPDPEVPDELKEAVAAAAQECTARDAEEDDQCPGQDASGPGGRTPTETCR